MDTKSSAGQLARLIHNAPNAAAGAPFISIEVRSHEDSDEEEEEDDDVFVVGAREVSISKMRMMMYPSFPVLKNGETEPTSPPPPVKINNKQQCIRSGDRNSFCFGYRPDFFLFSASKTREF